ncbi:MAG: GNAT family N-acetyltransferase, partial [Acetobacteraceae bacterium]|nr:GNAT family N-acetyltransferase [Acetobacteraceae bacterium]
DHIRRWPITVLEAMDAEWPGLAPFRAGLRRAALVTRTFAHFGNWHEPVPGSWTAYLEGRPGELRATISRKTRSAGRDPALRLEMVQAPEQLPEALAAYEAVYARSWKQKEPYPAFNRALVARLAASGALRFGLMWAGDQPIAAQYWTVWQGRGTVLKLAHDDKFKPVSPGTVLTAHAIRYLIETDRVTRLDFGRGDDPYKRGWARHRRQRIGLVVFNPSMFRGAAELIRHEGGKFLRSARLFLRHRRAEQDIRPAAHGDVP